MSRDPEGRGSELPDELSLDPVDSNLVDALDQMVDALQAEDAQARTVLLTCLLYTSPSPRDGLLSRMPSSA